MYSLRQNPILRAMPFLIGLATLSGCNLAALGGAKAQTASANTLQNTTSHTSASTSVAKPSTSSRATTSVDMTVSDTAPSTVIPGHWQVDNGEDNGEDQTFTEQETILSQAQLDLDAANQALQNKQYAQALRYAAQSYHAQPSEETRTLATYAASMLSPIESAQIEPVFPLETAILGQLRLNICTSQRDTTCIAAIQPTTVAAFQAIGDTDTAERLQTLLNNTNLNQPLVAVLLPLSGTDRRLGRAMLGAMLQAAGIYHHAPLPFALRFFDTQSNPQTIPTLLQDVQKLGAQLILGPLDIKESIAVTQHLDPTKTLMVGFSPNDEFTKHTHAAFQFSYTLTLEAEQLAATLVALNARKIIAISPDDAYATTSIQQLQNSLPYGLTISTLTYPPQQTDLRPIAQKVAAQSPDVIYLPTSPDAAERITSFLAQENLWCKTPGTTAPNSKVDTRKFTTCLGTSTWAPISDAHRYKSLNEALYLDYTDAATTHQADFATQFHALYHRWPAVQEILPFVAISMLKTLPQDAWQSTTILHDALQNLFRGQNYFMLPSLRQITSTGSQPYNMISSPLPITERTLVTPSP